jgi:signal transduction histidine kinase
MTIEFLDALQVLFDCLTDGVCVADAEGRLLYANAAAGRLLGPLADTAAKTAVCAPLCGSIENASCGADACDCPLKVPRGPEGTVTFKGMHSPSGRELRVRCFRVPVHPVERHFLLIEDVSAQAAAGRLTEQWRQMFAHDLRSPLSIAYGTLKAIADLGAGHRLDAGDLEFIDGGVRNCRRLDSLITGYLDATRLEEGRMPVETGVVGLEELARAVAGELAPAAAAREQALTVDVPGGLYAVADPDLLRRSLANLVDNALKFTPPGGRISVGGGTRGGQALLRVSDDGPGIPAGDLPHLFDRYFRATGARGSRGLGLGLAFCRAALRAMNGDVDVESEEGRGTTFTVRLPLPRPEGGAP